MKKSAPRQQTPILSSFAEIDKIQRINFATLMAQLILENRSQSQDSSIIPMCTERALINSKYCG